MCICWSEIYGLVVPSARYDCRNFVVYMQNLDKDCFVEEEGWSEFSWSDEVR